MDGVERGGPIICHLFERFAATFAAAIFLEQLLDLPGIASEAEAEDDLFFLLIGQVTWDHECGAGIEARPDFSREPKSAQSRRGAEGSVSAEEFGAIAGHHAGGLLDIDESDAAGKVGVIGIAREEGAAAGIDFRHEMREAFVAEFAENPFPVAGGGKFSGAAGNVFNFELGEFDRRIESHKNGQLCFNAVFDVLEYGVAEAVANDVGRFAAGRERSGRPEIAALLVANIERLGGGVSNGIVMPGGEPQFVAILGPGVGASAFGNDRSKLRIGEHVDPGQRGGLPGLERNHIFPAVGGKSAQPVVEDERAFFEFERVTRRAAGQDPRLDRNQLGNGGFGMSAFDLFFEGAVFIGQNNSRHRLQKDPVFGRNLFFAPDENASRFIEHLGAGRGRDQSEHVVVEGLPIDRVVLSENDEIDRHAFHPPIGMGGDHLLDQRNARGAAELDEDDGKIAGNLVAPKVALATVVFQQAGVGGAPVGAGVEERAGQAAEQLGVGFGGV